MKTITCTTPGSLEYEERPTPTPGPEEALLRVRRIGICGTDIHAFAGRQPFFTYPRVLGHELCGEIIALGSEVEELAPGDLVAVLPYLECGVCIACRNGRPNCCTSLNVLGVHSDGGMGEYLSVPASHLVKGDGLTMDQLALVECLAIGAHAVRRARIVPKEQVLVVGAGPIGLGLMQFARISGGKVIAMDIDAARLGFVREHLGIESTIAAGDPDARQQLADLTGGDFPTVIFDCTGNPASMMAGFHNLAHGGRYVLVSLVTADISFPDPEFHKRETTLLSSRNATREDFAWVIQCLQHGEAVVDPMITHRSTFAELPTVFAAWCRSGSGVVKAVVELDGN